jgi:hypothetical protein
LGRVFSTDASVQINVLNGDMSFPARTTGLPALRDLLVRGFSEQYEDVSTHCCLDSANYHANALHCAWLVCLRESASGVVRLGWGRYRWQFQEVSVDCNNQDRLVDHLQIDIDQMQPVHAEQADNLLDRMMDLPYPWFSLSMLSPVLSGFEEVQACTDYLGNKKRLP